MSHIEHGGAESGQAFLLRLTDAIRNFADPVEMRNLGIGMLAEHLDVTWASYCEMDGDRGGFIHTAGYRNAHKDLPERVHLCEFGSEMLAAYVAGRTVAVRDAQDGLRFGMRLPLYLGAGMRAWIGVPLVKEGRLIAVLSVYQATRRDWSHADLDLIEEVLKRLWFAAEQNRFETALRESDERFQQFAQAASGALWIRDAASLVMEYASPALAKIYGVEVNAALDELKRWVALIVPEDRAVALSNIERARRGEAVVHEFRIQRKSDQSFRWIRNTDFPLLTGHDRIQRIGGIAEDITEAKLAVEHQSMLLTELQHRVRNIMAIIRSITARTGERAESVELYAELMAGRLLALARVQALLTRAANVSIDLETIVRDEVAVQAQHEGQYFLDGPAVALSPKAAEVVTLAVHELSTNALKYGALSVPDGKVVVRWSIVEKGRRSWLSFDWMEEGAPARPPISADKPRRRGFGSELIEGRVPYELGGNGRILIAPGGAQCHLEFPLEERNSILETGAPRPTTVFGGALDMTGEPDLNGHRILVVEDDYYLATDAAHALRGAGAEITGVCATEEAAGAELKEKQPDAAVVDINLGAGPSFKIAKALQDRSIPFIFVTGYDQEVIPQQFAHVERLEKPVQLSEIVGAISKLLSTAA